jgi:oligopeptide transport system substrate-binding protein
VLKQLYTTDSVFRSLKYQNPEVDAAYNAAAKARNTKTRTAALVDAQRILVRDLPLIPIVWTGSSFASAKNVTGFHSNGDSILSVRKLRYIA